MFPPIFPQITGETSAIRNQTGSLAATVVFVCQIPGCYLVGALARLVTTDNVGTLTGSVIPGNNGNLIITPTISTGMNGDSRAQLCWLNAGDEITVTMTATGLTGTTYEVYVCVIRAL